MIYWCHNPSRGRGGVMVLGGLDSSPSGVTIREAVYPALDSRFEWNNIIHCKVLSMTDPYPIQYPAEHNYTFAVSEGIVVSDACHTGDGYSSRVTCITPWSPDFMNMFTVVLLLVIAKVHQILFFYASMCAQVLFTSKNLHHWKWPFSLK